MCDPTIPIRLRWLYGITADSTKRDLYGTPSIVWMASTWRMLILGGVMTSGTARRARVPEENVQRAVWTSRMIPAGLR